MLDQLNTLFVVADEAPTAEVVLGQFFEFTPVGIKTIGQPPRAAFDALGMHLAANLDTLRWQLGAWYNLYRLNFGPGSCDAATAMYFLNVSLDTIKRYAYIEANVPYDLRLPDKTIWYHDLVASLPFDRQKQCLDYLQAHNCNYYGFKVFVQQIKATLKQADLSHPPATRADRMIQDDQRIYQAEHATAVAVTEADQLRQALRAAWRATVLI